MVPSNDHILIRIDVLVFLLGVILVLTNIGLWMGGAFSELLERQTDSTVQQPYGSQLSVLARLVASGRYEDAVRMYEENLAHIKDASIYEKSSARFTIAPAYFKQSGSVQDARNEIRTYQEIANDAGISRFGRAHTLFALGEAYDYFGRDDQLLNDIFSGEFESYYVEGNPQASVRSLLEESYEVFPLSFTAARLSASYMSEVLLDDSLTNEERNKYHATAFLYLQNAEALVHQDIENDSSYVDSLSFALYRYWRAVSIGIMALVGDDDMRMRYVQEFDDTIAFLDRRNQHDVIEERSFIRLVYSAILDTLEEDDERTRDLLEEAVAVVESDPLPGSNGFVRYVVNEESQLQGDFFWWALSHAVKASETFLEFVQDLNPDLIRENI